MRTTDMLETYPGTISIDRELLARAIDSLVVCSQTCTACADACLAEDSVADLRDCISSDLVCAEICATTASVLARGTGFNAEVAGALRMPALRNVERVATNARSMPTTTITAGSALRRAESARGRVANSSRRSSDRKAQPARGCAFSCHKDGEVPHRVAVMLPFLLEDGVKA